MGPLECLAGRATARARIRVLSRGMTADGVSVYLIEDDGTKVLQTSPEAFPDVVRQSIEKAEAARAVLGNLGRVIPVALDHWEVDGISCALFEELTPISRGGPRRIFQVRKINSPVLAWLREVAVIDRGSAEQAGICLQALAQSPYEMLSAEGGRALDRLRENRFALRASVMHGDFTSGNVLLDPSRTRDFMVIDWGGSHVNGFPVFDLIKYAESVSLRPQTLRKELAEHAERLRCDIEDTRTYLAAALGYIWLNLDQFPPERFAAMAARNFDTLNSALNG